MVLSRVVYELFDHELEWLAAHPTPDTVELGRQLCLELECGSTLFVAWDSGPMGDDYHVAFAPRSFCTGEPDGIFDASALILWSPLIGREIMLSYQDESTQQVLAIRGKTSTVWCCSFRRGMWQMDSLFVCGRLPA